MLNRTAVIVALALMPAPAIAQSAQARTDVPVRTVLLFSSGVGYFEHAGTVRGDGATELRFSAAQINDILKSLVLQDLDGGRVTTVTYPSQDPVSRTLRSFQVDITNNPSLAQLLNQLRGARVSVQTQGERVSGTVLGVEMRRTAAGEGAPVETPILNVLTGASIRAIDLQSVASLSLDDPQLQDELTKALVALSQARDQDQKPVTIGFAGNGERRVRIGYVVETPVWKTSYRLLLDQTDRLQGWAIVENQTQSDWNGVSLSLVSGRPISFKMDLYGPVYALRPTVVQKQFAGLRPQEYTSGLPVTSLDEVKALQRNEADARRDGRASPSPLEQGVVGAATIVTSQAIAAAPLDPARSVQALATAAQLGELFQYNIGNVTLARQKSAMLPIITDSITIERLSIYNASVLPRNPLNGARLKNTTGKHLLAGPVTVLDRNAYAGDAQIDNVPPGQERLLSYGVDLDVVVDDTKNTSTNTVVTGRIEKGLLTISRKLVATRDYLAENRSDRNKQLVIEHPIRHGWKLVETQKPLESTATVYRFQIPVPANRTAALGVREEIVQQETIAMHNAATPTLVMYSRTGEIPAPVRSALARLIQLRQAVAETEAQIADRTKQVTEISKEQDRMRENMRTTGSSTAYYQRLLAKLNEQESAIERLQVEQATLRTQLETRRDALDEFLTTVTIG
jgi:hypothetical protein